MAIRKRTGVVGAGALAVAMTAWLPLLAQEPAAPKTAPAPAPAPPAKNKQDPAHRVPAHFGQIGLTIEQRASIYAIRGKRMEKIEALEKQIAAEKAGMLSECEAVLTDTQKQLLENHRRAAAAPAAKPAAALKASN
jgi:Spy/CpxP family protein refolding chaperone